jgi:hypothetical protein
MNSILRSAVLFMIALLSVGLASAGPPNGIQQTEWSFDWPDEGFYIPCLDDTLNGTINVTTRSHSFETPSGNVHMIESFYGTGYVFSKTTGNTWVVHFAIPVNGNMKVDQGETSMFVDRENYIPDEGNGRHFFIEWWFNLTVNANGELKVAREVPPPGSIFPDDYTRCVGKPN